MTKPIFAIWLRGILGRRGLQTREPRRATAISALAEIATPPPCILVFLDIWLQGSKLDGLQFAGGRSKRDNADVPVVMISGHGNIEDRGPPRSSAAPTTLSKKPFKSDRPDPGRDAGRWRPLASSAK